MQTPYGQECRFFYGDYYRGRDHEECRLLSKAESQVSWTSKLCKNCPVPGILQANACKHMVLEGEVAKGIFGFGKRMNISAYCLKSETNVKEPHVGCGQCHPLPDVFIENK